MRLRFWLFALDVALAVRAPHAVYLWIVVKASDATTHTGGANCGPGEPF